MRRLHHAAASDTIAPLTSFVLQQAYQINENYLVAFVSWEYGVVMYYPIAIEPAAMYCLNEIEFISNAF